jgi:hypothetical protein
MAIAHHPVPAALAAAAHPQVGMSDERILKDFHPDAEALYNMTMDLERVTRELADPNKRMPRRVGGNSRPGVVM